MKGSLQDAFASVGKVDVREPISISTTCCTFTVDVLRS